MNESIAKQTQCQEQMARLTKSMEDLEKMVCVLGEKVAPILSNDCMVKENPCDKSPEPMLAPLAERIKERKSQADRIAGMIGDILNRAQC